MGNKPSLRHGHPPVNWRQRPPWSDDQPRLAAREKVMVYVVSIGFILAFIAAVIVFLSGCAHAWTPPEPLPPEICEHAAPPKGCFWLLDKSGDCSKDKIECLGANPPNGEHMREMVYQEGLSKKELTEWQRGVILLVDDGEEVARLDPESLREPDGRLPNVIHWQGRTFERGWTNDGNTDADERLWYEVAR